MKNIIICFTLFSIGIASMGQSLSDNIFISNSGEIFVKADAPVYFFISPEGQGNQKILIPSSDMAANPMYFDGDGRHYLVYESKAGKERFLIFADGFGPRVSLDITNGLLFKHQNRIYVEEKATFKVSAKDLKSGVKQTYLSIDNLPFKQADNGISIERTGEYKIRIFGVDNVGNTGDTVTYSIVAAPDVTFKVNNIYFETESFKITPESYDYLNNMLDILKTYRELQVEISAHADTRGSSEYNLELSQKRAQAVVTYLTSKGISPARLKAKGYGDTQPINECTKGVSCPDSKHRVNRRVVFRFYLPKQKF